MGMELNEPGGFSVCSQEASDGYKESQAVAAPATWGTRGLGLIFGSTEIHQRLLRAASQELGAR